MLDCYIRGDIIDEDETTLFLAELAAERRRVFLLAIVCSASAALLLWKINVFLTTRENT